VAPPAIATFGRGFAWTDIGGIGREKPEKKEPFGPAPLLTGRLDNQNQKI
jgi:hypothetical protein